MTAVAIYSSTEKKRIRKSFAKRAGVLNIPFLLATQLESYTAFLQAHISAEATLREPCWIGKKVFIGAGAIVGPNSVIEDGSFIEPEAEVVNSFVGPDTFVGRFSELRESIAWGSTLANWSTNSVTHVPDAFVLCALRTPRRLQPENWLTRAMDCCSRNKEDLQMFWKHFLMDKVE